MFSLLYSQELQSSLFLRFLSQRILGFFSTPVNPETLKKCRSSQPKQSTWMMQTMTWIFLQRTFSFLCYCCDSPCYSWCYLSFYALRASNLMRLYETWIDGKPQTMVTDRNRISRKKSLRERWTRGRRNRIRRRVAVIYDIKGEYSDDAKKE